jgi:hypothetical protein
MSAIVLPRQTGRHEGMDEGPVGWTWIASGINVEPDV